MKIKFKQGITLLSLSIYVILFTSFTIFISIVMTSLNNNLFDKRGQAINYTNLNKLQSNIENSSTESIDVSVDELGTTINYSNGDIYTYDSSKRVILKNGGIFCMSVNEFKPTLTTVQDGKRLEIVISLNKYMNNIKRSIITYVEAI